MGQFTVLQAAKDAQEGHTTVEHRASSSATTLRTSHLTVMYGEADGTTDDRYG